MTSQLNLQFITAIKTFVQVISLMVTLLGALVLTGWMYDLIVLKSVFPGLATMKVNTALSFFIVGAALWLLTNQPTPLRRFLAQAGAALVSGFALLTLSQDIFGWDFGIDQLFFQDETKAINTSIQRRMSSITACNFMLLGIALSLLGHRGKIISRVVQPLALLLGTISLLALMGYAYEVQALYLLAPFSSMALHTALAFFMLSLAIFAAHPDKGMMKFISSNSGSGLMLRRLLPAAIIVPFGLGWLRLLGQDMGFYQTEMGTALFALAHITIFAVLLYWGANRSYGEDMERRRLEEQFRLVIESAPNAILLVNQTGHIELVNARVEKLFGYEREGLLGQPVEMLLPWEIRDHHRHYRQTYSATPVARPMGVGRHLLGLRQDGSQFPVEIGLAPMTTSQASFVMAFIVDITERKQAETKLKQTLAEVARSNAELEQFAYVASHDLQEPLRMISSFVQLLARRHKGQLDEKADEYMAYIIDGADRMKILIDDLLTLSRVGRGDKELVPTDSASVVEQTLKTLRHVITQSKALVTCDPLPVVLADAVQLEQLFQNLINNALKFCGQASPQVHVSAQPLSDIEWRFSVQDNGIGIDPQFKERIFVIFQRLHLRTEYPGTGIGLAICKKIVERHGGHIWVESQIGKGSIFYFTLRRPDEKLTLSQEKTRPVNTFSNADLEQGHRHLIHKLCYTT
jgi:PAS domain S-box-containing protein